MSTGHVAAGEVWWQGWHGPAKAGTDRQQRPSGMAKLLRQEAARADMKRAEPPSNVRQDAAEGGKTFTALAARRGWHGRRDPAASGSDGNGPADGSASIPHNFRRHPLGLGAMGAMHGTQPLI